MITSAKLCLRQIRYPQPLILQPTSHNIAPAKMDTITVPNRPNPALLTCGTTIPAAAPALPLAAGLPVPLALALEPLELLAPLAVELAPPVGDPVAVALFVPLQKMICGGTPFSMKQPWRSATDC